MSSLEHELNAAMDAVRLASRLTLDVRRELVEGHTLEKEDRSPVTVADFGAQAVILSWLTEGFPKIPAVGEEDARGLGHPDQTELLGKLVGFVSRIDPMQTPKSVCDAIDRGNHEGGAQGTFWALDPIDGTKGFLRNEQYAIALALIEDGHPVLGVLGCPALPTADGGEPTGWLFSSDGERATAEPLNGARAPETISVSDQVEPGKAVFCESVESGHSSHSASTEIAKLLNNQTDPVRIDSQCKYAAVARGQADLYLRLPTRKGYEEKIWDHAAGAFLVEAAGGCVTDIDGKPLDFSSGKTLKNNRGVVASNGHIHEAVLDAIRRAGI